MNVSDLDLLQVHNVAEWSKMPDGSLRPQRYPQSVRRHLSEHGQMRALSPANVEFRWVVEEGEGPRIVVSSEGKTKVAAFAGPHDLRVHCEVGPEPMVFQLKPAERLAQITPRPVTRFHPGVRRLMFWGDSIHVHSVEGRGFRSPVAEELPSKRYLVYGTSITHGMGSSGPHLNYAAQAAWHLHADLINLGLGGSAYAEHEVSDYIAERDDWDFASLGLSVNMVNSGCTLEVFSERVRYMLRRVAGEHPDRPVFAITLFPYFSDFGFRPEKEQAPPEAFRQALRDVVRELTLPNLRVLEGPELMTDPDGLTADLIHPGDHAMIEIGRNLAAAMTPLLPQG